MADIKGMVNYRGTKLSNESFAKKVMEHYKIDKAPLSEMHTLMRLIDEYYQADFWNEKKRASWRLSPATNYIYKMVAQIKAQVAKSTISPVLKTDLEDMKDQVKQLEEIIANTADIQDLDEAMDTMIEAGILLSTGHIMVSWDNDLNGGTEGRNQWVGNVKYTELDPVNVFPDCKSHNVQDCRRITIATPKTIEYIKERWEETAKDIKADQLSADVKIYTRPNTDGQSDEVLLLGYWWKYKGLVNVAYVVGDTVLEVIEDVYEDGKYPFARFTPKPLRKSYWGMMLPKQIKGNQESLNKLIEAMLTNAVKTANQQKLYDPNRVDGAKITNEPGLMIPVKGGEGALSSAYVPVDNGSVPGYVDNLIEMFKNDIKDIGNINDATTGATPGNVTAASAIAMLAEQATIPIEDLNKQLFKTMEEIYEMTASRIIQFSEEERTMTTKVEDEQGQEIEQPMQYRGTDFKGLDYKITIAAIKGNPTSKAYAAEEARQLFLDKVIDAETYLESTDFALKDKALEKLKIAKAQAEAMAQQEQAMAQQQAMQPTPDNNTTTAPQVTEAPLEQGNEQVEQNIPPDILDSLDDGMLKVLEAMEPEELQAFLSQPPETQIQQLNELTDGQL